MNNSLYKQVLNIVHAFNSGDNRRNDIRELARKVSLLEGALEDIAENECVYSDNCPDFVKLNHYECVPCKARKALENVQ